MANWLKTVVAAGVVAAVVAGVQPAQAQTQAQAGAGQPEAQHDHQQDAAPSASPNAGGHDMMQMHQDMMRQMQAADERLAALVKTMNDATGDAKVAALAAVVNELVAEQRAMHSRMSMMHEHMMPMMMGRAGRQP